VKNFKLKAINTSHAANYSSTDHGRGRCRIHFDLFSQLELKIGWIVHLALDNYNQIFVCTVWPDTYGTLQKDEITIEDKIVLNDYTSWTKSGCEASPICFYLYFPSFI